MIIIDQTLAVALEILHITLRPARYGKGPIDLHCPMIVTRTAAQHPSQTMIAQAIETGQLAVTVSKSLGT